MAMLAFCSCSDKEESQDIELPLSPTVETGSFTATIRYTFAGLSDSDVAYGSFQTLYCESGKTGSTAFEAWKNGNDNPDCMANRKGTVFSSGEYRAMLDNLNPDTEYECCVCFKSEDGSKRVMSVPFVFRTSAFVPKFGGSGTSELHFQRASVVSRLSSVSDEDMKSCSFGFVLSQEGNPVLDGALCANVTPDFQGMMMAEFGNLMPGVQYHCRPFAKDGSGQFVVYGEEFTFSTRNFDEMKVDMGLPSGIQWASCNLDAESPIEYGNYYSWGSIVPNTYASSYKSCWLYDASGDTCIYVGEISGTDKDPAHVRLGGKWRMPTKDDIAELIDNCQIEDCLYQGMYVLQFTARNGAAIRIPYSGSMADGHIRYRFKDGKARLDENDDYGNTVLYVSIPSGTQYFNGSKSRLASIWGYFVLYEDYNTMEYSEVINYDGKSSVSCVGLMHMGKATEGVPVRPVWDPNL